MKIQTTKNLVLEQGNRPEHNEPCYGCKGDPAYDSDRERWSDERNQKDLAYRLEAEKDEHNG